MLLSISGVHTSGIPWCLSGKESACHTENSGEEGSIQDGEDTLEEEMATHSSILAWEIPWTEDSGRLSYTGSQRVGYN